MDNGILNLKLELLAIIHLQKLSSPIGELQTGATDAGIFWLSFCDTEKYNILLQNLSRSMRASLVESSHPHITELQRQLNEYFAGQRKTFDLPLVVQGTDFQKSVWCALQTIPYGKTISYQAQALQMGKPKSVRAVANANGANRISIVIPCHRVIGANGKLTGYGGGLWRKKWLLDLEKPPLTPKGKK